ncbi:MAG: cysteine desulfurase [Candidatus Gracilibacteria bacterium]|nr:cysteine desulfurase [Candidatus Gracilibacteria bacterium]
MKDFKSDFPIFRNNPGIVFFDNAASTQKPSYVIDGIKNFMENDYANIHRGAYSLSERSESLYEKSKEKVKEFINASHASEINYTYNSTYALNMVSLSLKRSGMLKRGDKVLLSIVEHHANIVPWLILKEEIGIEIDYVKVDESFGLDLSDLKNKLTSDVKVVSLTYVSNVTGQIFDLKGASEIIRGSGKDIMFIIDGSQAIPHFKIDVQDLDCDFLFFTGHKVMAETGIGVLYGKREILKELIPAFGGGGAINWVKKDEFKASGLPHRFEPGTPNIIGAVSLLKALEYIESIGGYEKIEENENMLMNHFLEKYEKIRDKVKLIGSDKSLNRVGVFTFAADGIHPTDIADILAENDICVRAGHHCAEPFMDHCDLKTTLRASIYLYNTKEDIDRFFEVFERILNEI